MLLPLDLYIPITSLNVLPSSYNGGMNVSKIDITAKRNILPWMLGMHKHGYDSSLYNVYFHQSVGCLMLTS